MLTVLIGSLIAFYALIFRAGFVWQANKSPEQRVLDYMIDSNDPRLTRYALKLFGNQMQVTFPDSTGRQYALI